MKKIKKPTPQVARCIEKMRDEVREFVDKTDTLEHRETLAKSIAKSLDQLDLVQLDIKVSVETDKEDPDSMLVHLSFPNSDKTPYRQLRDAARKSGLKLTRTNNASSTPNTKK